MANLYKKPVFRTDPKTGHKRKACSKKWWGRFRDANDRERRLPLAADKMAAQAMFNEVLRNVEREKAGLIDPTDEQRKRPLRDHVSDFRRCLVNKGVTPKQVNSAVNQLQRMIDHSKWKLIGDVSASVALDFLGGLREDGKSAQTYNHYLKSAKQFTRWLVRDRRTTSDPLADLSKMNVSTDRRHDRRPLSPEEFERLVDAAKTGPAIETIPGDDRAMLYVLAAWTGFRKGEIGSLNQSSFRLEDDPPTATVAAGYSKRKRQDVQILHREVARRLKEWMSTKPELGPSDLLFPISGKVPGGKERKTHKMMQRDLLAARETWIREASTEPERKSRESNDFLKYCDNNGLFADFHSNRHLFITSLERANISPKMAQTLARHGDPRTTLGVYTHIGRKDQTAAIQSLPAPPSGRASPEVTTSHPRATRIDGPRRQGNTSTEAKGEVPTMVPKGAENGAVVAASRAIRIAPSCTEDEGTQDEDSDPTVALSVSEISTSRTYLQPSALACTDSHTIDSRVSPTGFEPVTFGFGGRNRDLARFVTAKTCDDL